MHTPPWPLLHPSWRTWLQGFKKAAECALTQAYGLDKCGKVAGWNWDDINDGQKVKGIQPTRAWNNALKISHAPSVLLQTQMTVSVLYHYASLWFVGTFCDYFGISNIICNKNLNVSTAETPYFSNAWQRDTGVAWCGFLGIFIAIHALTSTHPENTRIFHHPWLLRARAWQPISPSSLGSSSKPHCYISLSHQMTPCWFSLSYYSHRKVIVSHFLCDGL